MARNISTDRPLWRLLTPLIKDSDNKDKYKYKLFVTNAEFKQIRSFVFKKTENLPRYVKRRLIRHYTKIFNQKRKHGENNELYANIWLRDVVSPVKQILADCPFKNPKALLRDEVIEKYAKNAADDCLSMISHCNTGDDYEQSLLYAYDELAVYCGEWNVVPPYESIIKKNQLVSAAECALLRMCCDKWWKRKFMRIKNQTNEHILIAIGEVQKRISPYISAQSMQEWKQQQKSNRSYLENMELVSIGVCPDTGKEYENITKLVDMADASSANPKNRFTELMVRCKGLENIAEDDGLMGLFVTLTTPSKYHAVRQYKDKKGKTNYVKNDKWNGCTPRDSQAYLVNVWAKIRAELKRKEITYYGVRVAEPHHDATPHWHMLLFVCPADASQLTAIMKKYALAVDGSEKGANKYRFDVKEIDPSKGSATGYIAKYLSKNINGAYIENNYDVAADKEDYDSGKTASEGAQRATAWASRWCIRQFQFFGAEPVTIYREVRRIKESTEDKLIEKLRLAAECDDEKGRWYAFTKAMQENRISLSYEESENDYAEKVKKIKGLVSETGSKVTREVSFSLRKRGSGSPWSPVNNCTASFSGAPKLRQLGFRENEIDYLSRGYRIATGDGLVYQVKDNQLRETRV